MRTCTGAWPVAGPSRPGPREPYRGALAEPALLAVVEARSEPCEPTSSTCPVECRKSNSFRGTFDENTFATISTWID